VGGVAGNQPVVAPKNQVIQRLAGNHGQEDSALDELRQALILRPLALRHPCGRHDFDHTITPPSPR
jgi:hypothetical protein